MSYLFTSESVTEGHPDKMADQISDAILDAMLEQDPNSRVACEAMLTTGMCMLAGEITSKANVDMTRTVRETIAEIGYSRAKYGFDAETCSVITTIDRQSPDIAMGVDTGGAGDQGIMFGFACNETPELMPLPIMLAHKLGMQLSKVRRDGTLDYLRPDGKTQVTVEYDGYKPVAVHTVVVSSQHAPEIDIDRLRSDIVQHVVKPIIPRDLLDESSIIYHINPTGKFVVGGPMGDCGLTGRKIIVDTYGGIGRHGGGAFSGKDATKVDRSATYAARWVAKNIVAAGLAERCEVQLAYAIGVAEPVSIMVDTFGTSIIPAIEIERIVKRLFNLTPTAIIDRLDLRKPIYKRTAVYGHFGRSEFSWEQTDMAKTIKDEAGKLGA